MTDPTYKNLPFEATFFGQPVWRLENHETAEKVIEQAIEQNVALVSCRKPAGNGDEFLERAGFRQIETLVTLERSVSRVAWPNTVIKASGNEIEARRCAEIAKTAFHHDRFHRDPHIPDKTADAIKSAWVRNAVLGRADLVLLTTDPENHVIQGFNACMDQKEAGVIDLIAIDPDRQGRGIGSALLQAMHNHYFGKADVLRLGTQLTNGQSLSFYAKNGFIEVKRENTWHWTPGVL